MLVEEVFSHRTGCLGCGDAGQAAGVIAQLLDDFVAVGEEVLLEEVTQLEENGDRISSWV